MCESRLILLDHIRYKFFGVHLSCRAIYNIERHVIHCANLFVFKRYISIKCQVFAKIVQYSMHKASVMSVHTEALNGAKFYQKLISPDI